MFGTKNNKSKKTEKNNENNKEKSNSGIKSWLTGKLGSFLIFSAVGFALYKFQIINKLSSFFKKDKGKGRADDHQAENSETHL